MSRTIRTVVAALTVAASAVVGAFVPTHLREITFVLGVIAAAIGVHVFTSRRGFELATTAMLVALPFYSAFVVDLGVTVRLSYIFGTIALIVALFRGQLRTTGAREIWLLLLFFIGAVLLSVVINPTVPSVPPLTASGIRGVPGVRPLLQVAQLGLMVGILVVTVSYCSQSTERLFQASRFVVAGGIVAVLYAFYAFGSMYARVPFIEINNAMNTDYSVGYKAQNNSYVGGTIPRPRSTFPEPSNFGNFLLLIMPLMLMHSFTRGRFRAAWSVLAALTVLLFVVAVNSRGAMFGAIAGGIAMIAFARRLKDLLLGAFQFVVWGAALSIVVALFVAYSYSNGVAEFFNYQQARLTTAVQSGNRVGSDWQKTVALYEQRPLAGVGFGNVTYYVAPYEGATLKGVADLGGLYQRLLVEVGPIGTTVYILFLGTIVFNLWRVGRTSSDVQLRRFGRVLFFVLVADSVQRISTVGLATDAYLWVALGLAVAVIDLSRRDEQSRFSIEAVPA